MVMLRKLRWLLGVQQWIESVAVGLFVSGCACCAWLLLVRLFPLLDGGLLPYWLSLGVGGLAASGWAVYRRPTLLATALEADGRAGLQERLTSSLQLASVEGAMFEALHADARRRLRDVKVAKAFQLRLPQRLRLLWVPVLLFGVGYVFLPEFDLFGYQERQVAASVEKEARRVKAERLKSAVRPLKQQDEGVPLKGLAETAMEIERVAEELAAGNLTEKQALAKMSDLSDELRKRREELQPESAMERLAAEAGGLSEAKKLANNLLNGDFKAAAQSVRELQKKAKEGKLSEEEREKLAQDLEKLSDALKGEDGKQNSMLSEALAQAAADLKSGTLGAQGREEGALSLEDAASILAQMDQTSVAMADIGEWQSEMLGGSEFCRSCGTKLKACKKGGDCAGCGPGYACYGLCGECAGGWGQCAGLAGRGEWRPGDSSQFGNGMGGPGRGRGSSTGPLPDVEDDFVPTMLPGEISKGKFLASITQRVAPDEEDAEATVSFIAGVVAEAEQEAEQALTKEEIPPGSREFVRQYFGSLEPERQPVAVVTGPSESAAAPGPE